MIQMNGSGQDYIKTSVWLRKHYIFLYSIWYSDVHENVTVIQLQHVGEFHGAWPFFAPTLLPCSTIRLDRPSIISPPRRSVRRPQNLRLVVEALADILALVVDSCVLQLLPTRMDKLAADRWIVFLSSDIKPSKFNQIFISRVCHLCQQLRCLQVFTYLSSESRLTFLMSASVRYSQGYTMKQLFDQGVKPSHWRT